MALNLENRYPGRANPASSEYPNGSFKNESTEGAEDGTPLEIAWANDREGLLQKMLTEAGFSPNDEIDTVLKSQYFDAFRSLFASGSRPGEATLGDLCAGLPGISWHDPAEYPNIVGFGQNVRDSCVAWHYDSGRPQLLVVGYDSSLRPVRGLWEYQSSLTLEAPITLNFPSSPSHIMSICSDALYIYIAWRRSSDGETFVSKYAMYPILNPNSEWDVSLSEIYAVDPKYQNYFKLIVADETKLAISLLDITTPNYGSGVAVIQKSTGAWDKGRGNAGSYETLDDAPQFGKLVSDGSHVFWLSRGGTVDEVYIDLNSADLDNPLISDYSSHRLISGLDPADIEDQRKMVKGLVNIGRADNGVIAMHNLKGEIFHFTKADDKISGVFALQGIFFDPPTTSGYDVISSSDGLNAWFYYLRSDPVDSVPGTVLAKIGMARFNRRNRTGSMIVFSDYEPNVVNIDATGSYEDTKAGQLLFDGRDMIYVSTGGLIYRCINPMAR